MELTLEVSQLAGSRLRVHWNNLAANTKPAEKNNVLYITDEITIGSDFSLQVPCSQNLERTCNLESFQ